MRFRHKRFCLLLSASAILMLGGCDVGLTGQERLERARTMAADGDLSAAIIEMKAILQDDPVDLSARLALAEYSLRLGDAATASKEFRRAIELGANVEDFQSRYLEALIESGDFAAAVAATDELADTAPAESIVLRARALHYVGRSEDAAIAYQGVIQRDPSNANARIGLAELARAESRYAEAEAILESIPVSSRENSRFYDVAGGVQLAKGNGDEAAADFARAIELVKPDPYGIKAFPIEGRLAKAHMVSGNLEDARQKVDALLARWPEHPSPNYLAARLELQSGNPKEALKYAQTAVTLSPDVLQLRVLAGAAALQANSPAQAEGYLAPVVAANPADENARRLLARARLTLGRPQEAMEILSPIMSAESDDPRLLGLMTEANIQTGEIDVAIADLRQRLAADPENDGLRQYLAYTLLKAGRPGEAVAALEAGSPADEDRLRSDFLKFLALLRSGKQEETRALASRLVEESQDKPQRIGLVASGLADAGLLDDAQTYFQQVLELDPDNVAAMRGQTRLAIARGEMDAAATWLERAIEVDAGDPSLMIDRARIARQSGDIESTSRWLDRARALQSESPGVSGELARQYLLVGKWADAEAVSRDALEISSTDVASLTFLGIARLGQDDPAEAEVWLTRAAARAPADAGIRFHLARALVGQGKLEMARETLEETVALDPEALSPSTALIAVQIRLGDFDAAERQLGQLKKVHPGASSVRSLDADIAYAQGRFEEAEEKYVAVEDPRDRAIGVYRARLALGRADAIEPLDAWAKNNPDDAALGMLLAGALAQDGRDREAITAYEAMLRKAPEDPVALNNLAWLYMRVGDDRALPTAERAHQLASSSASVKDTLGWVLHKQGSSEKALPFLKAAAEIDGSNPEIRYHLAVVLAETGEHDTASRLARELLADEAAIVVHDEAQALLDRL